jgi:signal transduction histidine kinase
MFTSLRSRLWLTYALIVGVVLAVVAVAIALYLVRNPQDLRLAQASLRQAALSLPLDRLPQRDTAQIGEVLRQFDEESGVRVVLLSLEREVLVDTRAETAASFPQDLQVQQGRFGQTPVSDFRDAAGQVWLYTGRTLPRGQALIFAIPRPGLQVISILSDDLFLPLVQAGALALLLSLLLAFLISRWVAAPLQRMAAATRAVATGRFQPIRPEGPKEVQALASAFNEMTGKVQASQQSQRDFVANVSHELKTPLTSVQGFAQAMLDGTAGDPGAVRQSAQIIHEEAGRMHRMVVDLLDLARLDAGTAELQRAPLDLEILLNGIAQRFAPQSKAARVTLETHIEPLPGFIGDGDRLAQVFTNLVDNALKYTPPGGKVLLGARQAGGQIEIAVQDTGSGIPPDELSRIFERFYQLDKSRRGGTQHSTGLGLAIAREIVHAHGGRMEARSTVGQGSAFIVRLPAAQPGDQTVALERGKITQETAQS